MIFSGSEPRNHRLNKALGLLPNVLTLGAAFCGLTSLKLTGQGNFAWAALAIALAVILDVADGYAARRLGAVSAMGAELDSLADFLNFGIAPAILLYQRDLHLLGLAGWMAASFYALATGFRLAGFNVRSKLLSEAERGKRFHGLPSTGAAAIVLIASTAANYELANSAAAIALMAGLIGIGALMLSSIPFPSLQTVCRGCKRSINWRR